MIPLIPVLLRQQITMPPKPKNGPLYVNVGFIVHEAAGYSKTFDFTFPELQLAGDFTLYDLVLSARFTRTQQGLYAEVEAAGFTLAECARCLDTFRLSLKNGFAELYVFDRTTVGEDIELHVPESGYIDLSPLVRDYLLLDLPINPLCQQDCAGLCLECGANWNSERCEHTTTPDKSDNPEDLRARNKD